METAKHTLSVIVVTLNEVGHVGRLKASIDGLARLDGTEVETVLVDGGSSDGTAELARQARFSKVIELPGANIPACRNRGIAEASGDWLAFVDGDCEVAPDWLGQARPWLDRPTPVILGWPVEPPPERTWVQEAWHTHWLHKNRRVAESGREGAVREEAFRLVTTRNMLLHRRVLEEVGGFDEALSTGEDTDLVFRAYMKGIEVVGVPSLRAVHHGEPATLGAYFRQQLWHANRDSYRKIAKESGGKVGGNAPLFAAAFLGGMGLAVVGIVAGLLISPAWLLLAAPLAALIGAPAAVISTRAGRPGLVCPLAALYAAYGLARSLDLLGMAGNKASWKTGAPSA